MTLSGALAKYIQDLGIYGIFGTDIFIGAVPSEKAEAKAMWIVGAGGAPVIRNQTGEKTKSYIRTIFYRNTDAEDVDTVLQGLETHFNSKLCDQLEGYDTIDMEASGLATDGDIDAEDRTIGSIELTITVYQSS